MRPRLTREWEVGGLDGPHADPEFLTADGITAFYATGWRVHYNSARTGVRLVVPRASSAPSRWRPPSGGGWASPGRVAPCGPGH
ncbi:MAG TPA: hypothetical protein VF015_10445 [Acidimicrobiales bacterium]